MNIQMNQILLLLALSVASLGSVAKDPDLLYFVDAHSQVDSEKTLQTIIELMDQAGVRRTLLSGRQDVTSSISGNFAKQHPERITASIRTKSGEYAKNKPGYFKQLAQDVDSGEFGAMAELLMYHAQKGKKAPEVIVYPSDKRVQFALSLAKKQSWPLVVHIEFQALSPGDQTVFMSQLDEMLDASPHHPFVLIHMGQLRADEAQRLIDKHKNVYFMTSHSNPVITSESNQPWTNLFEGQELTAGWKALFMRYPDRFVLAFDNVWPEHWGSTYLRQAALWRHTLAALPPEVAHKVAHGNAERLWNLPAQ